MSIEAPPLERKLVAILAADVEGYSRMMHEDEEGTLRTLTSHRKIIDGLIAAATGNITSTAGDSVLAEFASVVEAVTCAVAIQTALAAAIAPLPAGRHMRFRIGINVGDVMVKDGGIFGDGVNVAARVEALAPPGGICVTRGVRDHMRDRVDWRFEDLGDHQVKNIPRAIQVFRVLFEEAEHEARGVAPPPPAPDDAPQPPDTDVDDAELTFWKSVELGNSATEYSAYLERYPDGAFVSLATARLTAPLPPRRARRAARRSRDDFLELHQGQRRPADVSGLSRQISGRRIPVDRRAENRRAAGGVGRDAASSRQKIMSVASRLERAKL